MPKGPIWGSNGDLKSTKTVKMLKKYDPRPIPGKDRQKVTNQDASEPQKVWFYYSKTMIFTRPSYPQKDTKMSPKGHQNEHKREPREQKERHWDSLGHPLTLFFGSEISLNFSDFWDPLGGGDRVPRGGSPPQVKVTFPLKVRFS